MSMQSHLAELEKRHRALEDEINDCLTHPAVDDLKIVELKRRKLQVKDEIERLRTQQRRQRTLSASPLVFADLRLKPPACRREAAYLYF